MKHKLTKKGKITLVMGDFNSKSGNGAEGDIVCTNSSKETPEEIDWFSSALNEILL